MVYSDQLRFLNPALPRRQMLYQYGYAIDPDPVMACPALQPAARLVYRAILRLCGRGTSCQASVDQIAAQAGVSARSVQRHITTLTLRDLVETEEAPGSETIFRLLPLPAWITEGRKPVLTEGEREKTKGERENPASPRAGEEERGTLSPCSLTLSSPQGCQPDGGGVTDCQGRGDSLSPPMVYKENKLENPISLSGFGSDSDTKWTDQPPAPEREGGGEDLGPVVGESKAETPPTPHQIVRTTCQALGFQPTQAQVNLGIREVATLCAGGFSLAEIGEGARYAAEQGWVRSFAGVKYYLPQALNAIALRGERGKHALSEVEGAKGEREENPMSSDEEGEGILSPLPLSLSPELRRASAEASPHRDLWEQVREKIATRIQRQSYRTWFEPLYIAGYDGQKVVLSVPSVFFLDWLEEHYLALIEATFEEVLGQAVEVVFEIPKGGG